MPVSSDDTVGHRELQFKHQLQRKDKSRNAGGLHWVEFVATYNFKKQQYKADPVALI